MSEFQEIITYLTERKYPEGLNREEKSVFQSKVAPYSLIQGILFKMGADDILRRCLEQKDRKRVMTALHSESSGGHFSAITTVNRIWSAGYWWPHLIRDVRRHVGSCDQCQRTGAPSFRNHWPLTPIIPLAPFEKWGIDFVGPFNPGQQVSVVTGNLYKFPRESAKVPSSAVNEGIGGLGALVHLVDQLVLRCM